MVGPGLLPWLPGRAAAALDVSDPREPDLQHPQPAPPPPPPSPPPSPPSPPLPSPPPPAVSRAAPPPVDGLSAPCSHGAMTVPIAYLDRVHAVSACSDERGPYANISGGFVLPPPTTGNRNSSAEIGTQTNVVQTLFLPGS